MKWAELFNCRLQAEKEERVALKKWFRALSELRGKERSLLHGDYYSLFSSDSSLAFLRLWDQSERFITAVNWGTTPEKLTLSTTQGEFVIKEMFDEKNLLRSVFLTIWILFPQRE